jgi:hypothetical protein
MQDKPKEPTIPNLFRYATSELSQDAFICWLLKWAHSANAEKSESLHHAGRDLLSWMLSTKNVAMPADASIQVENQQKSIDVLAIVNDKIAVIIEDKTQTQQHSDQLNRYLAQISSGRKWESVVTIYLQTGDQCDYGPVRKAGYAVLHRTELLQILKPHYDRGVSSDIFRDFYENLFRWEQLVESYRNVPVANWVGRSPWIGFFKRLQLEFPNANSGWSYVANPSGGFMGFWWSPLSNKEIGLYLLLEGNKLCVKFSGKEEGKRSAAETLCAKIIGLAATQSLDFVRPGTMRDGQNMTVALLREYIVKDQDGILDLEATVSLLRRAEEVLRKVTA